MNSSLASRVTAPLNEDMLKQLSYLCVLSVSINKACMKREGNTYASGSGGKDKSLTPFQKYLSKLALICDTQKGECGRTMTALVCLKGTEGPEYIFTSNYRKETELKETKSFLSNLLIFIGTNPDKLGAKPLQKQVLWRSLEFNFDKLEFYLKALTNALENCIASENGRKLTDFQTIKQLHLLQEKASFPRDIESSENARTKCLSDCETLIKAIQANKTGVFEKVLQSRTVEKDANSADNWCKLRHYLGRLHSYRQASEIIVAAATTWPDLFESPRIDFIRSAQKKHIPTPKTSNLSQIIPIALPEHEFRDFESDIAELRIYDLDEIINKQLQNRRIKTMIHGEVHLHNHLVQQGKTNPTDFWNDSMFIATSKPTCRLCQYYFNCSTNNFQVQTSHMNLYPKWRLPDIPDYQSSEDRDLYEDLLQDIIEQMQHDTLQMLEQKISRGKTNDSRTDSHSRLSTTASYLGSGLSNLGAERQGASPRLPSPSSDVGESWIDIENGGYHAR